MTTRQSIDRTLQANKDHQYALKVYTERLEAELASVDKLIVRSFRYTTHPFWILNCIIYYTDVLMLSRHQQNPMTILVKKRRESSTFLEQRSQKRLCR